MNFLKLFAIQAVLGYTADFSFNSTNSSVTEFDVSPKNSTQEIAPYIVGGSETIPFKYPFMVLINADGYHCGGSIIARNLIITAAHCLPLNDPSKYEVTAHRHNTDVPEYQERAIRLQVSKIIHHPSYDDKIYNNDIGLLVINNNNPNLIPGVNMDNMLQLDTQGAGPGTKLKIIGWGLTRGEGEPSSVLKEVDMQLYNSRDCYNFYGKFDSRSQVCTGWIRQRESSCGGDSGGPLVSGNTLIGLVSNGAELCDSQVSVDTRIAGFIDWINQYKGQVSTSSQPQQPKQPKQPQLPAKQPEKPEKNWWEQQQPQQPQQNWWEQQGGWWPQQQQGWWTWF